MNNKIAGLALLAVSSVVSAEGFYAGGGIAVTNVDNTLTDNQTFTIPDASLNAIFGKIGYELNESFAIEGRLAFGLGDDEVTDSDGAKAKQKIENALSIFAVAKAPVADGANVYGLIGVTRIEESFQYIGFSKGKNSDASLSFGIGGSLDIAENTAVNLEYIQFYDDSIIKEADIKVTGFTLGLTQKF